MTAKAPGRTTSRALSRNAKQTRTGDTGTTLIRILIASYFLALSIGLVPGMNAAALTSAVLPDAYAGPAGSALVFSLSFLILAGLAVRPATMLLALTLFWSGYITLVTTGFSEALGVFWRDLALIGGLLLTYREADAGRSLFRYIPDVRKIRLGGRAVQPRRIKSEPSPSRKIAPLIPLDTPRTEDTAEPRRAVG